MEIQVQQQQHIADIVGFSLSVLCCVLFCMMEVRGAYLPQPKDRSAAVKMQNFFKKNCTRRRRSVPPTEAGSPPGHHTLHILNLGARAKDIKFPSNVLQNSR